MKKLTQTLTAVILFLSGGSSLQAQQIPTLENVVYGGLIHTKGSTYVNWLEDGDHYSRTEKIRPADTTSLPIRQKAANRKH